MLDVIVLLLSLELDKFFHLFRLFDLMPDYREVMNPNLKLHKRLCPSAGDLVMCKICFHVLLVELNGVQQLIVRHCSFERLGRQLERDY